MTWAPFDDTWVAAMEAMFGLLSVEQGDGSRSPYSFFQDRETGQGRKMGMCQMRGKREGERTAVVSFAASSAPPTIWSRCRFSCRQMR